MIGSLEGTIVHKAPPIVLVDVHGVGYEVETPLSVFADLPATGEKVRLITHLHVREDGQALFGFLDEAQRRLFRQLLKVSGVGARLALNILSGATAAEFGALIAEGNVAALIRLPGIGRKTAERLVVELRDRIAAGAGVPGATVAGGRESEAQAALVALGYKPAEAARLVGLVKAPELEVAELIRRALRAVLKP